MGLIHILPDLLVNRIAAGEVIERPASVVKELLENSIDAEATRIEVAIEDGGRRLIRITDNGTGMGPDDVALAVVPHATSKIEREEDLFAIGTMGFRGEALASIAAVSDLRLVSRRVDSDAGHEIRACGDRIEGPKAAGAPVGTTIEVRQLFFNVPARQKFLRTAQTEFGHIVEQVARVALAHPRVEFRVTHDGREAHRLPAICVEHPFSTQLRERISDFYGGELAESLIPIQRGERGVELTGLVSPPAQSRSTNRWEYTFLNGRFIRDKFIAHAVREAYRGLIDPQRHPVTFLMLRIEPADVDINVHPTKIEVRWRDSNLIHSLVLAAMRDTFLQHDLTPPLTTHGRGDEDAEQRRQKIRQAMADFFKSHQPPAVGGVSDPDQRTLPFAGREVCGQGSGFGVQGSGVRALAFGGERPGLSRPEGHGDEPRGPHSSPQSAAPEVGRPSVAAGPASIPQSAIRTPQSPAVEPDDAALHAACRAERVLQIHASYLIAETPEGMIIIDQHALHERILYEHLHEQISRGPLESQRLLLPEAVEVSPEQMGVLEVHAELLRRLGLELTAFGPGTVGVHACPSLLRGPSVTGFVRDLIDKLSQQSGRGEPEAMLQEILAMTACKAAIKAGDLLSTDEIVALLAQADRVEKSSNCPHGRPTALRLTVEDLERQFKRT
jgi:DNA mismatch repair protein MutL